MERIITKELLQWKEMQSGRLPLVLYGARQVGKTYTLTHFGRDYYKNTIYVNFERMPVIAEFFDGSLQPERILGFLQEYFSEKITPGDTLVIFDEIQACERALTSLKYFAEEAPEYHIAAAGSLLGVAIHREKYSFPVGKVIMKTMYPLRFDEFLSALGYGHLVTLIREKYDALSGNCAITDGDSCDDADSGSEALQKSGFEMPLQTHNEIMLWLRRYLFIGGMPAVVCKYMDEQSLVNIPELQSMILSAYTADMAKYSTAGECTKIQSAFRTLPAQLAKDNKKFQYKLIRKGATAGLFGESISWLVMSGVALECDRVTRGEVPLAVTQDLSSFKLYMSDVGLLCAASGIMPENIVRGDLSDISKGALAENYVAQTLRCSGHRLFYWTSDSPEAEVDFLLQKDGSVIPLEVKYDTNVHAKSLKHFIRMNHPKKAVRISARNFGVDEQGLYSIPLYAAFCL
ncbi:MAG: ATP-binding protein [Lachnospiraceae bacterium]|nr:ATP-binding protein [Lachnospiraceae bacterium]